MGKWIWLGHVVYLLLATSTCYLDLLPRYL